MTSGRSASSSASDRTMGGACGPRSRDTSRTSAPTIATASDPWASRAIPVPMAPRPIRPAQIGRSSGGAPAVAAVSIARIETRSSLSCDVMLRSGDARLAVDEYRTDERDSVTTATEVALVLVFFIAAVVNGVAGLGFALVASAFTAVIVAPRLAALLLGAVTPIANVQQLLLHRRYSDVLPRLIPPLNRAARGVILRAPLPARP